MTEIAPAPRALLRERARLRRAAASISSFDSPQLWPGSGALLDRPDLRWKSLTGLRVRAPDQIDFRLSPESRGLPALDAGAGPVLGPFDELLLEPAALEVTLGYLRGGEL